MAASITLIQNTTTNTGYSNSSIVSNFAAGDVVVVVTHDTATGGGCSLVGSGATLEGLSSGATFTGNSGNRDFHTSDSFASNLFVNIWSCRIETLAAALTVSTTYGGTTGIRRSAVYRLRPDTGKTIPVRASRVVGDQSAADTTTGTTVTENLAMSAAPAAGQDVALIVSSNAASGTSGISVDADNDGTFELTALDYNTSSSAAISAIYDAAGTIGHRPGATVAVKYLANPGSGGHAVEAVVYVLGTYVNVNAGNATGTGSGYNATVLVNPLPSAASGTGTAYGPNITTPGNFFPGNATGTGTGYNATVLVNPHPTSAAGTGMANNPTIATTRPSLPTVTETDTAVAVTAYKIFGAEVAFDDPTSYEGVVAASATVSKTDAADAGDIRLVIKQGASSGGGYGGGYPGGYGGEGTVLATSPWQTLTTTPTPLIFTLPSPLSGTSFSLRWEVRTTSQVDPVVTDAILTYSFVAGPASGTGVANNPSTSIGAKPSSAPAAGSTANTAAPSVRPHPTSATATGSGFNATILISPQPSAAASTGTAYQPTAFTSQGGTAFPSSGIGTGAAYNATVVISQRAGLATATGTAFQATPSNNPSIQALATSGTASGIGFNASVRIRVDAGYASATGLGFVTSQSPATCIVTVDGQWSATCSVDGQWSATVTADTQYSATVQVE